MQAGEAFFFKKIFSLRYVIELIYTFTCKAEWRICVLQGWAYSFLNLESP